MQNSTPKLTSDLLWSMERKSVILLIALDLSVAFDTVDQSVLLTTLQSNFGIHGAALDWFKNYLDSIGFQEHENNNW